MWFLIKEFHVFLSVDGKSWWPNTQKRSHCFITPTPLQPALIRSVSVSLKSIDQDSISSFLTRAAESGLVGWWQFTVRLTLSVTETLDQCLKPNVQLCFSFLTFSKESVRKKTKKKQPDAAGFWWQVPCKVNGPYRIECGIHGALNLSCCSDSTMYVNCWPY